MDKGQAFQMWSLSAAYANPQKAMHMRSLMILLLAVTVLAGLSLADPVRAETFSSSVWQLQELPDEPTFSGFTPSSRYRIEFLSDGTLEIDADCNQASGEWDAAGDTSGTIDITITLTAVAGCPSPTFQGQFLDLLEAVEDFEHDGDMLTLSGDDGDLTFTSAPD